MKWMILFVIFMFTPEIQPTDSVVCSQNTMDTDRCWQHETISRQLIDYIIKGPLCGKGWDWLEKLCDDFGHRVSGSNSWQQALGYIENVVKKGGFNNVHFEEVKNVPDFERGNDKVTVLEPREMSLHTLAIPGTQPGIVEAEAVVVTNNWEFQITNFTGKIVVYVPTWTNYSETVEARYKGFATKQKGGVGLLVQSITPFSLSTLHTGRGGLNTFDIPIPAASLTLEEAQMLLRWSRRGKKITIKMDIKSKTLENTVTSKNLIFDITGHEFPSQIIVLSAHMDTWDLGQGALSDGSGCAALFMAMKAILELSKIDQRFKPRRTIRGIFWTGTEQGNLGGKQYFRDHWMTGEPREDFFFVSETNKGAFKPRFCNSTLDFKGTEGQMGVIEQIVFKLNCRGIPLTVKTSNDQGDVQDFADHGVPSVGYTSDRGHDWFYNFHQSNADYMNVLEKEDIDYSAAILAVLAHVLGYIHGWGISEPS